LERKLATVLFVDLVDSTSLVVNSDPEVVRRRVVRYFERASQCIEQFGGTVEKFAGDAVMAAFGAPRTHEDDAERAVRAAFSILTAVHELDLEARIGIEAGEVVVDQAESTFVTGEAVNIAARLQQAAGPGEVVLGPSVRRLTAGAIEVEDRGPVEVKGRAEPLWTWRAVCTLDGPRRTAGSWFVGREHELELLENALARAVRDRRAQLVTVFGEPGIGKSRLVSEFTEAVERATVLEGRTPPYGEGVTYWPLASMIKSSAGITDDAPASEAFEKLRLCCESEAVADLLAIALGVLGAAEEGRTAGELTWAMTLWAEQLADAQPLVLVFEDVQWAEEPLLAVIEHLARTVRRSPLLLVCVARPDLLDTRPTWGGGNPRALALELGPLSADESRELVDALLDGSGVPPGQRALALDKAEGNPLFLEETARMLADGEGVGIRRIPDSVQALIAARIDALDADDKCVLQRAALIGRVFWRGALDALSPDIDVASALDHLLERELIAPEAQSSISGERAFRFTHGLIRDVAHATVSKAERAENHRRVARWVAENAHDELADVHAHHLDVSARLTAELDGTVAPDLAHEAAEAVEGSGRRSLRRGSFVAARSQLLRSVELESTVERRYLAARTAWRLSDVPTVREEALGVLADARAENNKNIEGRTLVLLAEIALSGDNDVARASELADEGLRTIPDDQLKGLHDARSVLAMIAWWVGDAAGSKLHGEATLELARAMGRRDLESRALTQLAGVANAEEDLERALELTHEAVTLAEESGSREAIAYARSMAGRCAADEDLDAAETAMREGLAMFEEIGAAGRAGWAMTNMGSYELRRGNVERAEEVLREAVRRLRATQERGYLVEAERELAEALVQAGKLSEAERIAEHAYSTVGRQDVWSRASTLHALGLVRAAQGRTAEAETLLEEALGIVAPTMYRTLAGQVRDSLESVRGAAATTRV
jgi:class 3 adenylate cyclase/tetratricopeptide (TPR) repeat protein